MNIGGSAVNTSTKAGCGCPPGDPTTTKPWSPPVKTGGGCGCGGSCGGSCGGGCGSCGAISDKPTGSCTSGTQEASRRPGVLTDGCVPLRPRFFPGELVTDADMTAAVAYHRGQQLLSNGVIGGWGVYCGFSLCIDPETCAVCVGPGIAVDARGRMIVNDNTICVRRPDLDEIAGCDPCADKPPVDLYLAIVYDDCLEGAKPRYGSICGTGPDPGCDFSRIHERGRLVWIRDIPDSYWTSGCLVDPCADPTSDARPECLPTSRRDRPAPPKLDECTPCIGIRGGEGVELYSRYLDAKWALTKNVTMLEQHKQICELGVATLIDVISGAACEPCNGEAVVVLARVRWGGTLKGPTVSVEPLRRRVLSNAHLTYLVEWLMERVLCGARPSQYVPEKDPPPPGTRMCADPCLDDRALTQALARAAVGESSPHLAAAEARAAWWVTVQRVRTLEEFHQGRFLDIVASALPSVNSDQEAEALDRYRKLVGRAGSKPAIDRGVDLLYPRGVATAKRPEVEDAVYHFLHMNKVTELGTARAGAVLDLAARIHREILGLGEYPSEDVRRLEKVLPEGVAGDGDVSVLQRQVKDLEAKLKKQAAELDRVKGGSAPDASTTAADEGDAEPPASSPPAKGRKKPPTGGGGA